MCVWWGVNQCVSVEGECVEGGCVCEPIKSTMSEEVFRLKYACRGGG